MRPLRFTWLTFAQSPDSRDGGTAVVVSLNLDHEPVRHEVRLREVHAAALAGVGPLDVEQDGDTIRPGDGLRDRALHTFAQEPVEGCDDVSAAPAPVRVIVVTPAGIRSEELAEQGKVFCSECGFKLLGYLLHGACRVHIVSVRAQQVHMRSEHPIGMMIRGAR